MPAKINFCADSYLCTDKIQMELTLCLYIFFALMLRFWLPLPCLNTIFSHGEGPVDPVQFVIETTGVTDWLPVIVTSPERGLCRPTVGAAQTEPPRGRGEH